jgi:hypothetical protein
MRPDRSSQTSAQIPQILYLNPSPAECEQATSKGLVVEAARIILCNGPPFRGFTALFGHLSSASSGLDRKRSAGPIEVTLTSTTTDMRLRCLFHLSNGASNLQAPCGGEFTFS